MAVNVANGVVLRIGEKQFFTTKSTLAPARFFTTLWALLPPNQGEYFVDADPVLFEHILRHLRTRRFPLFFTQAEGFDTNLYLALLEQAKFYQVDALEAWISGRRYHKAVWVSTRVVSDILYGERQFLHMQEKLWTAGERVQILSLKDTNGKHWECPAQDWRHNGSKLTCIRAKCPLSRSDDLVIMRTWKIEVQITSVEIRDDVLKLGPEPEPEVPPPYDSTDG